MSTIQPELPNDPSLPHARPISSAPKLNGSSGTNNPFHLSSAALSDARRRLASTSANAAVAGSSTWSPALARETFRSVLGDHRSMHTGPGSLVAGGDDLPAPPHWDIGIRSEDSPACKAWPIHMHAAGSYRETRIPVAPSDVADLSDSRSPHDRQSIEEGEEDED